MDITVQENLGFYLLPFRLWGGLGHLTGFRLDLDPGKEVKKTTG